VFWPCVGVCGSASRVVSTFFFLGLASSCPAQFAPALQARPVHFLDLANLSPPDRCVLLSSKFCDGLPAADTSASPDPPLPSGSSHSWSVRRIVARFARDQASIYVAPLERANLKWDLAFVAGTAAVVATDRYTIGVVSHDDVNISRDISDVGLYGIGAAAGGLFVAGLMADNAHAKETGFLTAEALSNAYPVYACLQLLAGRERPDQGAGHGRFFQNHSIDTSFPSGHAMFSWAMAAVIAHEYPRTWVKVLAYGTAAAVSVTRYTGREHFVGDVAVGSFLGYFIGRHIFNRHCSPAYSERCHN
jgi:membrane-associated phospholipid phosphatase